MDVLARATSLMLLAVFAISLGHKLLVLRRDEAHLQPVMRSHGWIGQTAARMTVAAAAAEFAVMIMLLAAPAIGTLAASVLLVGFTAELRRLGRNESCGCLGGFLDNGGRAVAIARNAVLIALSALAAGTYLTGAASNARITGASLGVALIGLSCLAAVAAIAQLTNPVESHGLEG